MKIPTGYRKHAFSLAMVVSLAVSLTVFLTAFRLDKAHVWEAAVLAQSHFLYAIEMKDDMGVIDWAKSLEKRNHVLAFQALVNGKTVAEGGNRNYLPVSHREGVLFVFPATWQYYGRETRDAGSSGNTAELVLVCRYRPGPFFPALMVFLASLVTAVLIRVAGPGNNAVSLTAKTPRETNTNIKPTSPPPALEKNAWTARDGALLFLDKQFIIRKVSPRAALMLKRAPEQLLNSHLLDLSPDPRLMKAIENSEPARLSDVFKSHPGLCVRLKPGPDGIEMVLESADQASGA